MNKKLTLYFGTYAIFINADYKGNIKFLLWSPKLISQKLITTQRLIKTVIITTRNFEFRIL